MNAEILLFEDHTWNRFRPVATSVPVGELRCGLFSTRARLELAGAAGTHLVRPWLRPLCPDGSWAAATAITPGRDALWISGRLAPAPALVKALLATVAPGPAFAWRDEDGLVAARTGAVETGAALATWVRWSDSAVPRWEGPATAPDDLVLEPGPGQTLRFAAGTDPAVARSLAGNLAAACGGAAPALRRVWEIVPATAAALVADLAAAVAAGGWECRPFGLAALEAAPGPWAGRTTLGRMDAAGMPAGTWLLGGELWCGAEVALAPGCVVDARRGPVILDRGCDIAPHTLLEGPLYLGPGCRVKAGARIYGESSFGIGNRLAGEIGESTFGDFTNKQHEGFIGHAVLGSWVNLGAMTTCSDLKNNYGTVRVDLGGGSEDTGLRFVGLLAGDHVKTAIGTLFNTGTCVGFASNIFGGAMPPKLVPAFSWGGSEAAPAYGLEQAASTAAVVMGRRGCRFLPAHHSLFARLAEGA
ncbi:MAG: hypothetical protein IPO18_14270 [bacterium]|nr:hypothetical protein [bacterium]